MFRASLFAGLFAGLLLSLPALAQRPRPTKATVFTDVDGTVLSKEAYKRKLQTNQFSTYDPQVTDARIVSISLRPIEAPDKARAQAMSAARPYHTPAPAFTLTDLNGQTYSLAALRGKVVVLNFWFIKCAYCQEEMPALKQLTADYRANPNVVFLSLARDDAAKLRQYVAEKGDFGFAILPMPKEVASRFAIGGYPTTIVIDQKGNYTYDDEGYRGNLLRLREAISLALR